MCLAIERNTVEVGIEPPASRSGVRRVNGHRPPLPLFKQGLINFLVNLRDGLNMFSSMTLYRELIPHFDRSAYLTILHNKKS